MKPRESKRRKKERFKDSESFKRRQLTDRLKSMLLGPRELSKRARDKPENVKDLSSKRDSASRLTSSWLDRDNFQRNSKVSLIKQELKERIT